MSDWISPLIRKSPDINSFANAILGDKAISHSINQKRIMRSKWENISKNISYSSWIFQFRINQFIFQIFVIKDKIFDIKTDLIWPKLRRKCLAIKNAKNGIYNLPLWLFDGQTISDPREWVLLPLHVRTNINNKPNTWLPLHVRAPTQSITKIRSK